MDRIKYPVRVHEESYTSISCGPGVSDIETGFKYRIIASDERRIATASTRSIADKIVELLNNKEE